MDAVKISQWVGVISVLLFFLVGIYLCINDRAWRKAGRPSFLWFCIYGLFLFGVRLFSVLEWATTDQLRIVSGWATTIPFLMQILHLIYNRNIEMESPLKIKTKGKVK